MKQPEFSVSTSFSEVPMTESVEILMMNRPSTIRPSSQARTIISSSDSSWMDRQRNDRIDDGEPSGPFPIMTDESYGNGRLLVLSEPSLLINQMRERFDNSMFVENLLGNLSEGRKTILIDESHRDLTDPVRITDIISGSIGMPAKIALLTSLTIFFVIFSTPYPKKLWKLSEKLFNKLLSDEEPVSGSGHDLLALVIEKHPDWDRVVVKNLIDSIEGER
jgi:hypothetical protein